MFDLVNVGVYVAGVLHCPDEVGPAHSLDVLCMRQHVLTEFLTYIGYW